MSRENSSLYQDNYVNDTSIALSMHFGARRKEKKCRPVVWPVVWPLCFVGSKLHPHWQGRILPIIKRWKAVDFLWLHLHYLPHFSYRPCHNRNFYWLLYSLKNETILEFFYKALILLTFYTQFAGSSWNTLTLLLSSLLIFRS